MNLTLHPQDRHAVDLLLDRSVRAAGTGIGRLFFAPPDPSMGDRIIQAQRLFHLLQMLPSVEPPIDLVMRTLRYVDLHSQHGTEVRTPLLNLLSGGGQHPHA